MHIKFLLKNNRKILLFQNNAKVTRTWYGKKRKSIERSTDDILGALTTTSGPSKKKRRRKKLTSAQKMAKGSERIPGTTSRLRTRDDGCCSVNFLKYVLHIYNVVLFVSIIFIFIWKKSFFLFDLFYEKEREEEKIFFSYFWAINSTCGVCIFFFRYLKKIELMMTIRTFLLAVRFLRLKKSFVQLEIFFFFGMLSLFLNYV